MTDNVRDGADAPDSPERRRLFLGACAGASALVGASLATVAGRVLLSPLTAAESGAGTRLDLGALADFESVRAGHGPREVVVEQPLEDGYSTRKVKARVLVVKDAKAASGLAVLSATCSHLGCGVAWNAEKKSFVCPCHGGVYAEDGSVTSGPPPKPLARLTFVAEGGRLSLDPSKAS